MDVRQIVEQWLRANGYDGLVSWMDDCGCLCDDLMPCGCDCIANCTPGYKVPCADPIHCEVYGACNGFHIVRTRPPDYGGMALADMEKQAIRDTLRQVGGNRARAAKVLGIGERTLYSKIKKHGLGKHAPSAGQKE